LWFERGVRCDGNRDLGGRKLLADPRADRRDEF
jgi:hypothetical protein